MTQVLEWVKSGLLFGIFSSMIILLCPNKSYEKHMNMVVGLLFILVIIHPVMTFLNLDGQTYISYIQNYITASENGNQLSEGEKKLYGESIKIKLTEMFEASGYPIHNINVMVDENGRVSDIIISFSEQISSTDIIEKYLTSAFGEDINIIYE